MPAVPTATAAKTPISQARKPHAARRTSGGALKLNAAPAPAHTGAARAKGAARATAGGARGGGSTRSVATILRVLMRAHDGAEAGAVGGSHLSAVSHCIGAVEVSDGMTLGQLARAISEEIGVEAGFRMQIGAARDALRRAARSSAPLRSAPRLPSSGLSVSDALPARPCG